MVISCRACDRLCHITGAVSGSVTLCQILRCGALVNLATVFLAFLLSALKVSVLFETVVASVSDDYVVKQWDS